MVNLNHIEILEVYPIAANHRNQETSQESVCPKRISEIFNPFPSIRIHPLTHLSLELQGTKLQSKKKGFVLKAREHPQVFRRSEAVFANH